MLVITYSSTESEIPDPEIPTQDLTAAAATIKCPIRKQDDQ